MSTENPLWLVPEDVSHHSKYLATGGRGKTRSLNGDQSTEDKSPYTPTPVDVVNLGIEPLSYLVRFGGNSCFHQDCQHSLELAMKEIEASLGKHSHLMATPWSLESDVDLNVMLSKVNDQEFLSRLSAVSTALRKEMLESHLR